LRFLKLKDVNPCRFEAAHGFAVDSTLRAPPT
jgi:hypothetical protein